MNTKFFAIALAAIVFATVGGVNASARSCRPAKPPVKLVQTKFDKSFKGGEKSYFTQLPGWFTLHTTKIVNNKKTKIVVFVRCS